MKIAMGVFDGVHLGHIKVIERAHKVLTFHPHPNKGVHLLTTVAERKELINNLEVVKFSNKLGSLTPEEFVRDFLVKKYKPEVVCVGDDFAFGYNRSGNVETLKKLGEKHGFQIEVTPEVDIGGKPVRSSRIRILLGKGKVEEAAQLLGRDYKISGKVIHGRGIGKKLGFPTANIKTDKDKLIPKPGVYAGKIIVNNQLFPCAISIGEQSTFGGHHIEIEAYIFNFKHNIYRKKVTFFFEKFIRLQRKFKDKKALQKQIAQDIKKIKNLVK
ncbi:MAG: bifunctional riboflavin kinase/FAD synthetase [Candidatus Margulisbacteria bacterium]|nr:bifunctional riboflavin kinase/FAD synthetase [Candidatus Margulisiibacteriota bacterium]